MIIGQHFLVQWNSVRLNGATKIYVSYTKCTIIHSIYKQNEHESYIFGQNPRRDQVPGDAIIPGDSKHISGKRSLLQYNQRESSAIQLKLEANFIISEYKCTSVYFNNHELVPKQILFSSVVLIN